MIGSPRAAPDTWPYDHRSLAEVDAERERTTSAANDRWPNLAALPIARPPEDDEGLDELIASERTAWLAMLLPACAIVALVAAVAAVLG